MLHLIPNISDVIINFGDFENFSALFERDKENILIDAKENKEIFIFLQKTRIKESHFLSVLRSFIMKIAVIETERSVFVPRSANRATAMAGDMERTVRSLDFKRNILQKPQKLSICVDPTVQSLRKNFKKTSFVIAKYSRRFRSRFRIRK